MSIVGEVLFAGGEGLPEEVLAGRSVPACGLLGGCAFLPPGHLPGFLSYEGPGTGLGGPLKPPSEESQEAAFPYSCRFRHMLTVWASGAALQGQGGGGRGPREQQQQEAGGQRHLVG